MYPIRKIFFCVKFFISVMTNIEKDERLIRDDCNGIIHIYAERHGTMVSDFGQQVCHFHNPD
jgi:hypothetical protein